MGENNDWEFGMKPQMPSLLSTPSPHLVDAVNDDISSRLGETHPEFPVTAMSRALAETIEFLAPSIGRRRAALDIGTGCGIHAFQMALLGFQRVHAIDICKHSVRFASDRWSRISKVLGGASCSSPRFVHSSLQNAADDARFDELYDLISFNPPAYFTRKEVDVENPLEAGLFTGPPEITETTANPLHDYFAHVVARKLAPGGVAVCTWPGVQCRNVVDPQTKVIVHPASILRRRLGWTIAGPDHEDGQQFYNCTSLMSYAGPIAERFRQDLTYCIQRGEYSPLVNKTDFRFGHVPSFRFGILALRRGVEQDSFSVVDLGGQGCG